VNLVEFLHEGFECRQVRRSVRHRENDELHVSPFSGCENDVTQGRDEVRLMSTEELLVVDVEPDENALGAGLEVRILEEHAKLGAKNQHKLQEKEGTNEKGFHLAYRTRCHATYFRRTERPRDGCSFGCQKGADSPPSTGGRECQKEADSK
jgi:hypothetical protein